VVEESSEQRVLAVGLLALLAIADGRGWAKADHYRIGAFIASNRATILSALTSVTDREERLIEGLEAAVRCAELALFVIRKQGVMPNSSWETGFNSDLESARTALSSGRERG